jgi:hypothetical protein
VGGAGAGRGQSWRGGGLRSTRGGQNGAVDGGGPALPALFQTPQAARAAHLRVPRGHEQPGAQGGGPLGGLFEGVFGGFLRAGLPQDACSHLGMS